MRYSELKKQISQASKQQKIDNIPAYIAYAGDKTEWLISNFMDVEGISDNHLHKAIADGLLKSDWDVLEVI